MKLDNYLIGVQRIFLDTAPVIYYVENHPIYGDVMQKVIDRLDDGSLKGIISPVTLAECFIIPLKQQQKKILQDFADFLLHHQSINMVTIETNIALLAAQLRVQYGLKLPDAFQIATAIRSNCDVFLTNDQQIRRVADLQILVIADFINS
ncbi:type II toxin-antitoxin system VapC family toxin [Geminocystis sp. CENA526]|uniref:type II toxin-antitoxin system VapC family toxin n=1 Tax=Geminocystis sp. CENA526 TaxID=1355871 RepID=UPI003D6DB7EA